MRSSFLPLIFLVCAVGSCVECGFSIGPDTNPAIPKSTSPGGQVFKFSSGNAYHPEGFGEWRVVVDSSGQFSVFHDVRGSVKNQGTFTLSEEENAELWERIRAAELQGLAPSNRKGLPDEVQYTFVVSDSTQLQSVKVWGSDAAKNEEISALVDTIAYLIEEYTQEKPVLK